MPSPISLQPREKEKEGLVTREALLVFEFLSLCTFPHLLICWTLSCGVSTCLPIVLNEFPKNMRRIFCHVFLRALSH